MDNKELKIEDKLISESNTTLDDEGDEKDELPEYEDDEDFKRQMNEAIMRNMNKLEEESNNMEVKKIKQKKIKEKKISNNISLGSFIKVVDEEKPKVFVSKRKLDKIGVQYKRVFNPRKPPYLLVQVKKKEGLLNENDFPSL
jgi:hypothetical protein